MIEPVQIISVLSTIIEKQHFFYIAPIFAFTMYKYVLHAPKSLRYFELEPKSTHMLLERVFDM